MKEYFPIGTTVSIKDIENELFVIIGLAVENSEKEKRDYVAIRYPVGAANNSSYYFFNHIDIEKVVHMGFVNEDHECYVNLIHAIVDRKKLNREEVQ